MQTLSAYCSANNIEDIDDFIYKCFKQGFDIKKYGLLGKTLNEGEKHLNTDNEGEKDLSDSRKTGGEQEKWVEKEVIREIRVEVPVEVIKEVEKIIYTTDDTQVNELLLKIQQLEQEISTKTTEIGTIRQEFSTKTEEMENIFQNKMSKKDGELDELRRNLDIPVTNDRLNMLQQTIQNLNSEIRDLKKKNEELEKKLLEQPKESDFKSARFHGSSNLNDGLYK
jgi:predicted RNase H-like nuclease (RuvC/YqgF family)